MFRARSLALGGFSLRARHGLVKDTFKTFKHLRKTRHTHHPVDDARGNAEALLHMKHSMDLKLALD